WEAPGAELITEEQWPRLRDFMADLVWIEHIGGRGFAAMAKSAPRIRYGRSIPIFMPKNSAMPTRKWR
ncbi:hypothetical protein A3730_28530, partial [Alcanivorax sp. HI0044]